MRFLLTFFSALMFLACSDGRVKEYKVEVVQSYPHDTESYTQGLFFHEGKLYESTGLHGKSTMRMVDLQSGEALKRLNFNESYFIEGSVILSDKLYVLTWESRVAFIYDADSLQYKSTWKYPREGWGLTTDGKQLIASDGSAYLYFMNEEFGLKRKVMVKCQGRPVRLLNELEYIDGRIWANIYTSNEIVIINPKDGNVEAVIDCNGLLPRSLMTSSTDVLNGIAYDSESDKIFLTGKNWPRLYEIRIVRK